MTTLSDPAPVLGAVLAGGLSRRLGGGDKGLRPLGGATLLERVAGRLAPQCAELVLNANGDPARFGPGWTVVPDGTSGDIEAFAGPLAGVLAVLDWAALHRPDLRAVATVAADTPFLPPDLVARLARGREEAGVPVALAASGGRRHPAVGLWAVAVRDRLRRALRDGERRVGAVAAAQGAATVAWPAEPVDPFFNVNTPADWAQAERLAGRVEG